MTVHELESLPERELWPGFVAKMVHSETMTLAFWRIEAGAELPEHEHPHEQVLHLMEGSLELTIEGETARLEPGAVAVIPSNARHGARTLRACRILDVFHPVREDYR